MAKRRGHHIIAGTLVTQDNFDRADGAVGNGWVAGNGAIVGNVMVLTPSMDANVMPGGDFASWPAGVPAGFTLVQAPPTAEITEVGTGVLHGGGGTGSANLFRSGGGAGASLRFSSFVVNQWYRMGWSVSAVGVAGAGSNHRLTTGGTGGGKVSLGANSVGDKLFTAMMDVVGADLGTNGDPRNVTLDNYFAQPITRNTCFCTRPYRVGAEMSVAITRHAYMDAGVVHSADAVPSNNFVLARIGPRQSGVPITTEAQIHIDKCVGGVYTRDVVAKVDVTYVPGAILRLIHQADKTYDVYYNGVLILDGVIITDVVFDSAIHWGLFSTGPENSFNNVDWGAVP